MSEEKDRDSKPSVSFAKDAAVSSSERGLSIYPSACDYPEMLVALIPELLGSIRTKCRYNNPLNEEENLYLADAFDKILAGDPPRRALYLVPRAARPFSIHWDVQATIYNAVENLKEDPRFFKRSGKPNLTRIFKELAGRADIQNLFKLKEKEILKPGRIKKIYQNMAASIERSKESAPNVK